MPNVPFSYGVDVLSGTSKKPIQASLLAFWVRITRQHVTRLCRAGVVPGAFQTKGGHWRVRPSKALADWIVRYAPERAIEPMPDAPIAIVSEANERVFSYSAQLSIERHHFRQLERAFRRRGLLAKRRDNAYLHKISPILWPSPTR